MAPKGSRRSTQTEVPLRAIVAGAVWLTLTYAYICTIAAGCSGDVQPEKTATETFGCYVGECVPALDDTEAGDASSDAAGDAISRTDR